MRSISTKLILAFLSIGIISLAIIFITARWNTRQEFINFLSDQSQSNIALDLSNYHQQNGSWDGVEFVFVESPRKDALVLHARGALGRVVATVMALSVGVI